MKVTVLKDILSADDQMAGKNRELLDSHGITAINIMASPGAGKTSLILKTIEFLKGKARVGVIEGDIAGSVDADRIGAEGISVVQINTGGGCHLDAGMVANALASLPLDKIDLLFIENVGNLVCPAAYRLGEHQRVVLTSTPEGDDKPQKYPVMFSEAEVVLINKIDLLSLLDFDPDKFKRTVTGLNPDVRLFELSSKTGEGFGEWINWLLAEVKLHRKEPESTTTPKALAAKMRISPKRLRSTLRSEHPRDDKLKHKPWRIPQPIAKEVEETYKVKKAAKEANKRLKQ